MGTSSSLSSWSPGSRPEVFGFFAEAGNLEPLTPHAAVLDPDPAANVEVPGGTSIRDRVDCALPFGPFGELAHALFVRRRLEQIFSHRPRALEPTFPPVGGTA